MEIGITLAWSLGLVLLCIVAWGLNLIALPGNWIAVALVVVYAWMGPAEGREAIGWQVPAICFFAALVGEIFEFIAGALGAQRAGASRKATLFAVLGSIVGALVGAVVGVPIPVVGSVVAALLFGALGATAGAMLGEWSNGKSWKESWTVGHAAFWGRLIGTLGKISAGGVIVALVIAAVVWP